MDKIIEIDHLINGYTDREYVSKNRKSKNSFWGNLCQIRHNFCPQDLTSGEGERAEDKSLE